MRLALGSIIAALTLVAAGCGGSDNSQDATTAWADGLCSALTSWTGSVQGASETLQDTSSLSADSVSGAIQSVIDATATLADDVQALGRPELDAADEAQQTVTSLSDTLQTGADTLQKTLDESGSGLSGLLQQISTITSELRSMASAVSKAFSQLEQLDATGELEQAFNDADSCDTLVGSS
jgi:hypothetical protein